MDEDSPFQSPFSHLLEPAKHLLNRAPGSNKPSAATSAAAAAKQHPPPVDSPPSSLFEISSSLSSNTPPSSDDLLYLQDMGGGASNSEPILFYDSHSSGTIPGLGVIGGELKAASAASSSHIGE